MSSECSNREAGIRWQIARVLLFALWLPALHAGEVHAQGEGPHEIRPRTLQQLGAAALLPTPSHAKRKRDGGDALRTELWALQAALRELETDGSSSTAERARGHSAAARRAAQGLLPQDAQSKGGAAHSKAQPKGSAAAAAAPSGREEPSEVGRRLDALLQRSDALIANPARKRTEVDEVIGEIDSAVAAPTGASGPVFELQVDPPQATAR